MGSSAPSWYQFTIERRRAWILTDGPLANIPPSDEFPSVSQQELAGLLADHHLPTNRLTFEQNCLVLETERGLTLFDTGMGSSDLFGPYAGRLQQSFKDAGLDPVDVSAVFLTHAHPDHLFGLSDAQGRPSFRRAEIFISRADFEFWTSEDTARQNEFFALNVAGAKERMRSYREQVRFIAEGDEPVSGIKAIATPGHTVGHMSYMIGSGDDRCLLMGDTAYHFAISFVHPEWHSSFDTDPVAAAVTRNHILGLAADQRLRVIGYHFPFPGIGYVDRVGTSAFRYAPEPMDLALIERTRV